MVVAKPVDEDAVVEYYLQPHNMRETFKKFHIGEKRLKDILLRHNIKTRSVGGVQQYSWNKNFFILPSRNLAYF